MKKEVLDTLEKRFKEIKDRFRATEKGNKKLENLQASYQAVIKDLKKDRSEEWIAELDEENYTVRVLFSDNESLYYVSTGLIAFQLGWLTVEKLDIDEEDYEEFKEHPMKSGVSFDGDNYFRGVMNFRWWSVKTRKNIEKELPLTDPLVKDYIDAAIGNGWRPKQSDNLREDQNKDIVQLDHMIRKTYEKETKEGD